jgi:hypothetical protein
MRSFVTYFSPSVLGMVKSGEDEMVRACSTTEEEESSTGFWWKARLLGRPRRSWADNIKVDLEEVRWTGLIWMRIKTSGQLLGTWKGTFALHKMLGNSSAAPQPVVSRKGLRIPC